MNMMFRYALPLVFSLLSIANAWNPLHYAFDPRIHTLGNHGALGKVHAAIAPVFTKMIDYNIYGEDIRAKVISQQGVNTTILDLGCGTGFSTSNGPGSVGIDLSEEMLNVANKIFPDKHFIEGNAEDPIVDGDFDVVSIMFLFHEVPQFSRKRIINKAKMIAHKRVIIVDIAPEYVPSPLMESGEPYLRDYLANIRDDLDDFKEDVLVKGHVHMWTYDKPPETKPIITPPPAKRYPATTKLDYRGVPMIDF